MRVTIQGEALESHFGIFEIAKQSLERYSSAVLLHTLSPMASPLPEWRNMMAQLSASSAQKYRQVVYNTPEFDSFFIHATPIRELGLIQIGSRPAKRNFQTKGVTDFRAIPWIFAFTQCRLHLPVWLGLSLAFNEQIQAGNLPLLQTMYSDWPFFRSTLDLIQMVLYKSHSEIFRHYLSLSPEVNLGNQLLTDLQLTIDVILRISGQTKLLQFDPVVRRAIEPRLPLSNVLNLIQVMLVKAYRDSSHPWHGHPCLQDALVVTIQAIAAAMGNTG
ncbi:hypothetical protein HMI55_004834 [Coelomomyces lativittatus]|nr:hypothetical protein HMI55_004834 [Coelomomyces lativittatus]